jgi:16S rRNA (cytosine1402-N4)-methyltransferase
MSATSTSGARWDSAYHAPVLVDEVSSILRQSRTVLDCTLGGGGHSLALLEAGVHSVTALDRDPEAIAAARARLAPYERAGRFRAILGNYALVDEIPELRAEWA